MLCRCYARRYKSFFDTLKHAWLVQFIEHRVAGRHIVQLIQK
jgi:retron-type reverse transcriptase